MERDILCQLIQFQHNISQLNDNDFVSFCGELMHKLKRKEIESILFCGLNSMRQRGCTASLKVKDIIQRGSNITFKIKTNSKHKRKKIIKNNNINMPPFLCKYLCDFLDIQSLLKLQSVNRYFCVISRKHNNYSLLLTISPYNSIQENINYQQPTNNDNNNILHSVNETALNSGYYKKFFIPIKKLGAGSYGSVFLVNHIMHGIYLGKFAMKIVCVGDDICRLIDILREVRTLQQLNHRNVIDYKHSWLENYQPATNGPDIPCLFILMEFADSGSILDYIQNNSNNNNNNNNKKWLTEHEIWTIIFETCMGLKHLHEHGIVHRDIKPGNLLMTSLHKRHRIEYQDLELYDTNYRIVISDLGQADFVNHKESVSKTGNTGSFGFASPELVLGSNFIHDDDTKIKNEKKGNEWDESCDIWSLGHLLYFLTFSKMPYENCLNDDNHIDDIPDINTFYNDIVSGHNKLWFPSTNHRSKVMINMIKKLCQIDPKKRPSLDSIIMAIANILRSHQYISISYSNNDSNRLKALLPPPSNNHSNNHNNNHNNNNNSISHYPVIKYVPRHHYL